MYSEFADIIDVVVVNDVNEIRIILKDTSFIDVWFSLNKKERYSYHWERKHINGTIYRHDNVPHLKWNYISTFPKHFHNKTEQNVEESFISDEPEKAIREILKFVRVNF